jgi:predicted metal-dependent phosphoesterase TrpH
MAGEAPGVLSSPRLAGWAGTGGDQVSSRHRGEAARADLHLHSTRSDGLLEPAAVVDLAADLGLEVVALTDHDTLDGLDEASRQAAVRGLELIRGVEISTRHPRGGERHVLAFGIDVDDEPLRAELERNRRSRKDRVQAMVDRLATVGIQLPAEDVFAEAQGTVGRPHVADALVRAGHVKSRQEAFDRWLGDGRVAHVKKDDVDVRKAIELVHGAGGVAVLAHPGRRWDPTVFEELVRDGLDGFEAIHPTNSAGERKSLEEMAARWGVLVTGGSDNHGDRDGTHVMRTQHVPRALADGVLRRIEQRRLARVSGGGGA